MGITYGITIAPKDDRYILVAENALDGMAKAASPGAFFVDFIPIRMYLCNGHGICGSDSVLLPISQACAVRFHDSSLLDSVPLYGFTVNGFLAHHSKEKRVNGVKP